jgi:hypothetical protein
MQQHSFGKIPVRVEQGQPLAGSEILCDQVQQQRRFAGASLADDLQMPAPLVGSEHHEIARDAGAEKQLLWWCSFHGRNGAGVPCASRLE